MNHQQKTKKQLIEELLELRQHLENVETTKAPLRHHLSRSKSSPCGLANQENHQHNPSVKTLNKKEFTELKRLRQELARLDQLNLVGEMAASIGHEVRNPLTTVRGFLQLLSKKRECISFKEHFDLMIDELDRANSIISEFLSLAKNKKVELEPQNLNTIIKTISPLIESHATLTNKNLILDLSPIPDLRLDSQEIRQLILNLVHNGLESMPPHTSLIVKTAVKKNQVVLSIKDEGTGIPPELMQKLGTPFFTTKESGTGLGLTICYRIATRHKAAVEVSTTPHGTTFFVKFNQ